MPTKMSLENIKSTFSCTTLRLLQLVQLVQLGLIYPGTGLVGTAFNLRQRIRNTSSCAHVLHKTLHLVISCCYFAATTKKCTKIYNASEGDCFLIKLIVLFYDVLLSVAIIAVELIIVICQPQPHLKSRILIGSSQAVFTREVSLAPFWFILTFPSSGFVYMKIHDISAICHLFVNRNCTNLQFLLLECWFVKTTLNISGIHAVERFHFNNRLY